MNFFHLRIALRYLFSKKSTNAINIITGVSMAGMGVGTMALILVLSVFNGFESLVVSLYNSFNPDVKVEVKEGKVFSVDDAQWNEIVAIPGVEAVSKVLEENAILKYGDAEYIATIKGVDAGFEKVTDIDSTLVEGSYVLAEKGIDYAILGAGIKSFLSVNLGNLLSPITIYMPRRGKTSFSLNPSQAFQKRQVMPAGVFAIQQDFDSKYMLVSLDFARDILDYQEEVSALELKLSKGTDVKKVKESLASVMGDAYSIRDRYQQDETLFKIMQTEKWAVYAILTFILIIAAFNIIGSLSMLVLEKKKDIAMLKAMGATEAYVQKIFLLEGLFSALIGSGIGALLALTLALLQINFGIVPLPESRTFIIDSYPVQLKFMDFALVLLTVVSIGLLASWFPARKASKEAMLTTGQV